jgi:radical SAM superfamily enzyme YgiQ (UPF0313 family)
LLTSRSCPNQCTYCNMFLAHGRKWRPRSPENVLAEIEHLVGVYGVRQFSIIDDNFTLGRSRAKAILRQIIDRRLGIRFITPNGLSAKSLDDELIQLLKEAGALEIAIAVESGSEFIRNQCYNKRLDNEQIFGVVQSCKRHRLPVRAFYMVGAPEESDETIAETIALMRKLRIPSYVNITTPYKGTRLFEVFREKGLITEKDSFQGASLDLKLPVDKLANRDQINRWRRQVQQANILSSLGSIVLDRGFINLNALKRYWHGVLFPARIDRQLFLTILERFMPLRQEKTPTLAPPRPLTTADVV